MIIPQKLNKGDEIRIIAPARSLALISEDIKTFAIKRLEEEGFKITFSRNCYENDIFFSSSVNSRVEDIHSAFKDKNVKAILTVIGGFNSNQLLKYLDYDLIKLNPKILCGYSDITALCNAITTKTGLITYSGPHFSTFGMQKEFNYNLEYFKKCLINNESYKINQSEIWSDDEWYKNQEDRNLIKNEGFWIINEGNIEGIIYGGNLCTFNLLQGTEYFPDLNNTVFFLEDDGETASNFSAEFDRNLQSLIHQCNFELIKGIVIGRFQKKADINLEKLRYIISTKKELRNIPIIANVDFGHTNPLITYPIGGKVKLFVKDNNVKLEIIEH